MRWLAPDVTSGSKVSQVSTTRTEWRIGELAAATRLTVRTLHYYDQVGLVTPSFRSSGGHRIYTDSDLRRLYAVVALRRLKVPVAEIAVTLDDPAWSLRETTLRHRAELADQITALGALARSLDTLLNSGSELPSMDLIRATEQTVALPTMVRNVLALLPYRDLVAAQSWLVETFQFTVGTLERDAAGTAVHGSVLAGQGFVHLHPPAKGLAPPGIDGPASAIVVVGVADADAHLAHARRHGASVTYGPDDMPYGVREYGAQDLEGHLWSFQSPLPSTSQQPLETS